jgi:hypothetical protein
MTNPDRVALVPIIADSSGREVIPGNAIWHGSANMIMERVIDSRARNAALTLLNDAERAKNTLQSIRAEQKALAARADAISNAEEAIRQLADAVNTLTTRMDAFEEEKQAKAEAEERDAASASEYALPPGIGDTDEDTPHHTPAGDLHSISPSTGEDERQLAAIEDEHDDLEATKSVLDDEGPAGPVPTSYGGKGPPLSYVRGEADEPLRIGPSQDEGPGDLPRELTNKVPAQPGTDPNLSGTREPTFRTPVAVSW